MAATINDDPCAKPVPQHDAAASAFTISDGATVGLAPGDDDLRPTIVDPALATPEGTLGYDAAALGELPDTIVFGPDDSLVGRQGTIAGYEILGELGRGAMGVVYKARQRGLKRIVALKMIRAGSHSGPDELARFRSEAVAVAELQHPNIVQLYEVGEEGGQPFFSLEFVDGPSLAKKISGVPQQPRESARLAQAMAEAMELAHGRGIIHRDLKPSNVLLTASGQPKISDFGLVKRLEDDAGHTQSGSILGTPSYMAPEQAEGRLKDIGPCADVYALGAVLYELLTGRPPFRAATVLDTLYQVRHQEPVPPSQFQPNIPRDLETICLKCLQKEIAKRYATSVLLAEDLRRFTVGEPILARPVGRAERLWRFSQRNPSIAALSACVSAVLIAWAVTSTWLFGLAKANERAALANAATAHRNELAALANAATARQSEDQARLSADLAKRRADSAAATAHDAIGQMIRLGDNVLRRLQTKHDPAHPDAEWLRLRDDVMAMLLKEMVPMAERIEGHGTALFAVAASHQSLGDLLRKFARGDEARHQYQEGVRLLEKFSAEQPDSDQARANLGVMLARIGDTALELDGDAQRARDEFHRAWTIQDEIARHPRSNNFTAVDNHRMLSGIELKLGVAELALGHPAEAVDWCRKAVADRNAWTEAEPRNVAARSYLSEAELWLAVTVSHQGQWPPAHEHFELAIQICEDLARRFPNDFSFKSDLAEVFGSYADALVRFGKNDDAEKAFNRSLREASLALAHSPDNAARRLVMADAHERLGACLARRGQSASADPYLKAALLVRAEMAELEPGNLPRQAAHALALARVGKHEEARRRAEGVFRSSAQRTALLLPLARSFAVCAAGEAADAVRRSDLGRAVNAIESMTAAGYRDLFALATEPDLTILRTEPPFQAIVDQEKARVR